jgi:hypothetical protein
VDDALSNSHFHHPESMPPPPMPAYLDPTTISSTKPSINTNQYFDSPFTTPIPPSISPLTSFANLSLLSPALLRSTPPPSLLVPFARPPANPGTSTATPAVPPFRDKNTAAWSPLRRHTAVSLPPSLPASVSLSSHHNDVASIAPSSSSPPSLTTIPANDVNGQPVESPSCTPSPPPSPFSLQPETLLMDTNNEIQSTPHSPDPMWRADSPSGDHVSPSIELNIPAHVLNHDGLSESQLEISVTGSEGLQNGTSMNEDGHRESPVLDVNFGDHMDVGVFSSPPALRVPRSDTAMVMDHCGRDEEENLLTDTPDYMSDSNGGRSPARRQSPTLNDVHSSKLSMPFPLPQPLLLDSASLSTSQHNPAAAYPTVKEEDSCSEDSREQQPSHPPAPKVKMSLRDFALRKKKQREEEMSKNVQDTPSSAGVDFPFGRREGGGSPNGIQVNPVGQVDEESRNGKAVELKEDSVDSRQNASTLSRNMVKDEVVEVPGTSSMKPTTVNGIYHPQPSSPPLPAPLSTLLVARIQADTSATYSIASCQSKEELIEQPIHTTATIEPKMMESTRYAGSILPINPDPHHFQSCSAPQPCQEDGEIGEILDTPLRLPSLSLPSSSSAAPPAMNRLTSMATTIPGSITPLPRGSTSKRADVAFTRSTSASQVRHSPPTHPRSFNASPPYRQQPPSASTPPPPARGPGVPPTAPRALRQYMSSNRPTPTTPTVMTSSSSYPSTTSSTSIPTSSTTITTTTGGRFPPYIPRGPSADRDKVRDIDQTQYARSLSRRDSREGGHAWGR